MEFCWGGRKLLRLNELFRIWYHYVLTNIPEIRLSNQLNLCNFCILDNEICFWRYQYDGLNIRLMKLCKLNLSSLREGRDKSQTLGLRIVKSKEIVNKVPMFELIVFDGSLGGVVKMKDPANTRSWGYHISGFQGPQLIN